jgi:3-oxoacyl-[acyl-carrier-protein] synthase-3
MTVGIVDCASALPAAVVGNAFFGAAAAGDGDGGHAMFGGTARRRHIAPGDTAAQLIATAAGEVLDRNGLAAADVGAILTNVSLPDEAFYGCGAEVKRLLGASTDMVIDMHNSGCVSFVTMLELARTLIDAGRTENALICNAQTAAGRVFALEQNRVRPQSAIPGDGCGVALVAKGARGAVLSAVSHCYGDYACDMRSTRDCGIPYWQASRNELRIDFAPERIASILERGNALVPDVVREACGLAGRAPDEIDVLITNQPNPIFLEHWRTALGLEPEQHIHTFSEYANLFGAAIPINLDHALRDGRVRSGQLICLAGFSHAGDYAAATLIDWRGTQLPRVTAPRAGCQ